MIFFRCALGFVFAISNVPLIAEEAQVTLKRNQLIQVTTKTIATKINQSKNAIDFDELPYNQSIKTLKGNGSNKIAVFYEIDCIYCKQFEKYELSKVNDVIIYTFLFANEDNKDSDSWKKALSIWCAADITKAWSDFITKDYLARNEKSCDAPLDKNKALAVKLGVKGTPTLFFSNGTKAVGVLKAKEIEQRLLDATFYSD